MTDTYDPARTELEKLARFVGRYIWDGINSDNPTVQAAAYRMLNAMDEGEVGGVHITPDGRPGT